MADVGGRLGAVEEGLTAVETRLGSVETAVQDLRGDLGKLRGEVGKLRVLGEENAGRITVIAEVQSHHGKLLAQHGAKLDEIADALRPLASIDAFIKLVAHDHELRLTDLEKRAGIRK